MLEKFTVPTTEAGGALPLLSGALWLLLQSSLAGAQEIPGQPAAADPAGSLDQVIVTGTRRIGLKAIDSVSPVLVLDSSSLERTGQPDLIQALAQNLPSFTAQAAGNDMSSLTLSARLRGLSPNDTLVLINGKRRHTTANLAVLAGPYQGGAAADLNFIPVAAIDHIEVLQDGAAAQYGTDAIAGVVNIILKKDAVGGSVTTSGGRYFDQGGNTGDAAANYGFDVGQEAYLNLSAETRYHGHSDRSGIDPRLSNAAVLAANPALQSVAGYPRLNHTAGDAAYHLHLLALDAGYRINRSIEAYGFATYGKKTADAFENYRLPSRLPSVYPEGFSPRETTDETDYGVSAGVRGQLGPDWRWDASVTTGRDKVDVGVVNSANISLYAATGATPTDFHAGRFTASQTSYNLDLNREVNVGWNTPLSLAFGLEHRLDSYEIGAGDAASRYKEGSQAFPGFQLTDAGYHSRNNSAIYADVAGSPVEQLKLDAAARYEKFSDFGSARVGKLSGRYQLSPAIALRGTISNGFRAPTVAEQYYSATNVTPSTAFVQLAPNSSGAALVGVNGLKPEKSTNYSLGLVLHPAPKLSFTLDAYQIKIVDRIVGSGVVLGAGGAVNSPAVIAAIKANGNVLDPTVVQIGINVFSNLVDTRSRGLDAVLSYASNFDGMGSVDWSVAANANQNKVLKIKQAPTQLLPQKLLDAAALSDLETASPRLRLNLGALWKKDQWTLNLRESIYGPSSEYGTANGSSYFETRISTKATTDLDLSYRWSRAWTVTIGANNLFNQYPNQVNADLLAARRAALSTVAIYTYPNFSPIGINGGYWYAKASYRF